MREGRPKRFLVAEDDPDMRALVVSILRATGAQVVEARDGAELLGMATRASENAEDGRLDLIFADIQMPHMTAIDVMERLPALTRRTPVVLFTGVRDRPLREKAYDLGAQAIVNKPLNPIDLIALVRFLAMRSEKGDVNALH
jgi:CheY-like chemotaxis protein